MKKKLIIFLVITLSTLTSVFAQDVKKADSLK
ncbi:MAG: hypothetical protein ACJAWW_000547, partial [Sulfurimonas sp.]